MDNLHDALIAVELMPYLGLQDMAALATTNRNHTRIFRQCTALQKHCLHNYGFQGDLAASRKKLRALTELKCATHHKMSVHALAIYPWGESRWVVVDHEKLYVWVNVPHGPVPYNLNRYDSIHDSCRLGNGDIVLATSVGTYSHRHSKLIGPWVVEVCAVGESQYACRLPCNTIYMINVDYNSPQFEWTYHRVDRLKAGSLLPMVCVRNCIIVYECDTSVLRVVGLWKWKLHNRTVEALLGPVGNDWIMLILRDNRTKQHVVELRDVNLFLRWKCRLPFYNPHENTCALGSTWVVHSTGDRHWTIHMPPHRVPILRCRSSTTRLVSGYADKHRAAACTLLGDVVALW